MQVALRFRLSGRQWIIKSPSILSFFLLGPFETREISKKLSHERLGRGHDSSDYAIIILKNFPFFRVIRRVLFYLGISM